MKKFTIIFGFISLLALNACKKHDNHEDHDHDHENELITTVMLHFIESGSKDTLSFAWRQPAGPRTAITIDTIQLSLGKTYAGLIEFLDESKSPIVNVTAEIKATSNEHRVVYTSSTSRLQTTITDVDTNFPAIELGLTFNAETSAMGAELGSYQVVLRHYTVSSPKTGGIQNGTTDAEVSFPLVIK